MNIEYVKVGSLETNCYILSKNSKVLVIDPGDEIDMIDELIAGREVIGVIVTHRHFDHIGALDDFEKRGVKVYDMYNLAPGKTSIGQFEFECIHTPGHKEDSISVYFRKENILFAGDFIFEGTIGRWDLPGGSFRDMVVSIENILSYPDEMKIYPGHGNLTTLGAERKNLESYIKHF